MTKQILAFLFYLFFILLYLVGLMISGISGSDDPHKSLDPLVFPGVFLDIAVFLRFPFKGVLFLFSLLSRMALRWLFQRLFDASSDSDIS